MHVESESKIKLETGVEITKAANGSSPDPKNFTVLRIGSATTVRIESDTKAETKKNCYIKLMKGRVVVNIPLDGFKNFGKHPVGINVKPDLTKFFFLSTSSATTCHLQNNYATRRQLKTSNDACFL